MPTSILIVDDEVDACRNLVDILSELGHQVVVAHDAQSALQEIARQRFDVALLDLMMPGMDGAALYEKLKQIRPETVAVLTTAYPGHPRADVGLQAGIWRVVPKPLDLERLLQTLEGALQLPLLLVVDDDRDLCESLWDLFWERGFRVGFAEGAAAAAKMLQESAVQIALVDMQLADGDGSDVIRALHTAPSRSRTILITGHREQFASSISQLHDGIDAVCYKPFDFPTLLSTVDRLGRSTSK